MIRILANDGIDPLGKSLLEQAGFQVDTDHIPQEQLPAALKNYDAITVRSATQVRKDLIDACPNLRLIGRGGVGMDNIDVNMPAARDWPWSKPLQPRLFPSPNWCFRTCLPAFVSCRMPTAGCLPKAQKSSMP